MQVIKASIWIYDQQRPFGHSYLIGGNISDNKELTVQRRAALVPIGPLVTKKVLETFWRDKIAELFVQLSSCTFEKRLVPFTVAAE